MNENMTRKKLIIGIIILIAAVLIAVPIIKEFIDYSPYLIGGAPLSAFGIYNDDSKNHSINVQIFNSNNSSFIDKTFEIGVGNSQSGAYTVHYPNSNPDKPWYNGWKDVHEKERLFPKGTYTFIVTMDNNINKTQQILMDDDHIAEIVIDKNGTIDILTFVT